MSKKSIEDFIHKNVPTKQQLMFIIRDLKYLQQSKYGSIGDNGERPKVIEKLKKLKEFATSEW